MATAHPQISGLTDWAPLARGGFSTVWTARQITLDRMVAVKIDQRTLDEEKEQRRFLREAGAAGRLSGHPGIVTVHDAGILPDDRPYMVMELCTGGSLTRWLKSGERPTQEKVRDVGVRIADALAAAHARGVLHRDVKPANILVDGFENPGLADFGLAAIPDAGMDLSVTMEALTPAYAPREVFYQQPPTEYGDVYSLCATLYAFLDGKPPRWPEEGTPSLPEILELQREPVAPLPLVNAELMAAISAGLVDDPEQRPTAAELRDRLAAVRFDASPGSTSEPSSFIAATAEPITEPNPTGDRADTPHRRRRRISAAFVAVALVILAVLAGSAITWIRANNAATPAPAGIPSVPVEPSPTPSASGEPSPTESPSVSTPATPSNVPAGFSACDGALGSDNFCVSNDECWTDYGSLSDAAANATPVSCRASHVQQTFAAGRIPAYLQKQSQYESNPQLSRLCSIGTLKRVLADPSAVQVNWQVNILPTQLYLKDDLVRCLVQTGGARTAPLRFKTPS